MGTTRGLNLFDSEFNRFEIFRLEDAPEEDAAPYISSMVEVTTPLGSELYVATSSGGIYVIDVATHALLKEKRNAVHRELLSGFIARIHADAAGRLWIPYANGGLTVLDLRTLDSAGESLWHESIRARRNAIAVTSLAEDPWTGNVIIGTFADGILVYDASMKLIRRSRGTQTTREGVMSLLYSDRFAEKGKRGLLAGMENNGLKIFDPDSEELSDCLLPDVPYHTDCWKVHNLLEDRQGNVWIGAFNKGLLVLPRSMYGFDYMNFSLKDIPGDNSACVTSVAEGADACLWVGTDGAGLFRVDGRKGKRNFSSDNTCLNNNSILALCTDKRGTLWIGTYLGGLFTCSADGRFSAFPDNGRLGSDKVAMLAYDAAGDRIFAGTSGGGLSVIDASLKRVTATYDNDENKWISSMALDAKGVLWVCTYNGLMRLDPGSDNLLPVDLGEGFSNLRINAVRPDGKGFVWLGTNLGLLCYDPAAGHTQPVSPEGLNDKLVKDILVAVTGDLWLSVSGGLTCYNPLTGKTINYYASDGLQGGDFRSRAVYQRSDGRLYFGGMNGLTSILPQEVDRYRHEVPPVGFTSLTVMNETVDYDPTPGKANRLDKHITEATALRLDDRDKVFSIGFSVPEFTNPMKLVYAYRLEGFDAGWTRTSPLKRSATYTNLPSGRYEFRVKAYFDGSPDRFSERTLSIYIRPAWYARWWAWCLYALAAGAVLALFRHWSSKRLENTHRADEARLNEMRLGMFTDMTHEIRTPLTLVMSPLKRLRDTETVPQRKDLFNLMYRNCIRINRIVNQLMDIRKIDEGKMPMHFVETDVVYFIRDIMLSFEELASSKHIDCSLQSAHEVENLWIDQGNFDKVIFNVLSNAFKFTPDGGVIRLTVSAPVENDGRLASSIKQYVEVTVYNSGSHLDETEVNRVFDRFYQAASQESMQGSGVGLNLSKLLMELHHGAIRARSEADGVSFIVTVPVGNSHLTKAELSKTTHHQNLYVRESAPSAPASVLHEDAQMILPEAEAGAGAQKVSKNKRNLVIVDDDAEFRNYLKQLFMDNYNIHVFSNGAEAWPHIVTQLPDVVLTDYLMAPMDGLELCRKIRGNPTTNHIPVIMLTSQSDENSEQRGSEAGADRYLVKPVSIDLLASAIQQVVSTRDALRNKFSGNVSYDYRSVKMENSRNQLMALVTEIIRKNIDNPDFCVEDISREVGMSRVNLNRRLKEEANISPSSLIRSTRLRQAAYLLINNDVNISEVAYKVGFSTHSYFSSSFHDYYGMSPKEFVLKYQNCKDEAVLAKLFG